MQIWVDADACPKRVKEVLYRAADRTKTSVTLVANQYLATPRSPYIQAVQVPSGFDVADNEILNRCEPPDLVITADVPLADAVVAKGCGALNPRGKQYTPENIKDHLQGRDMREELRDLGMIGGGPDAYGKKDLQAFANALDKYVARFVKQPG
jgi:uncharacterized protein YaiI (UPF0178 family)